MTMSATGTPVRLLASARIGPRTAIGTSPAPLGRGRSDGRSDGLGMAAPSVGVAWLALGEVAGLAVGAAPALQPTSVSTRSTPTAPLAARRVDAVMAVIMTHGRSRRAARFRGLHPHPPLHSDVV